MSTVKLDLPHIPFYASMIRPARDKSLSINDQVLQGDYFNVNSHIRLGKHCFGLLLYNIKTLFKHDQYLSLETKKEMLTLWFEELIYAKSCYIVDNPKLDIDRVFNKLIGTYQNSDNLYDAIKSCCRVLGNDLEIDTCL